MQTISHCYQQGDADVLCQWFPRAPETAQLSKSKEQKLRLKKKKKHPRKVPPETLLKLPHFQQTAVKSLPSAPLRKGPDEGTAPNSSCRSLWHAAACLDSMGVDLAGNGNAADPFG